MIAISLIGKKALVGGSSKGLGKAIAIALAQCGATVTLVARNEQKLVEALKDIPQPNSQKHNYIVADYANLPDFQYKIDEYLANNTVDILVNNTNGPAAGTVFDKGVEDYQTAFNLLFQTVVYTTSKVLTTMQKNGFGRIINVASITTKEPLSNLILSNTMRSAVVSWAKTLSKEVAKDNIAVNTILTGYFDTERLEEISALQAQKQGVTSNSIKENMVANIPARRLGAPEEYGYLVAFLASDLAAYITGTTIPIDGGLLKSI